MLAKITRGNQITIPKEIVQKAKLSGSSPYVDVDYANGVIHLKPVTVEERVQPEQYEKFQKWALSKNQDDNTFGSLTEGIAHLKKRPKKT